MQQVQTGTERTSHEQDRWWNGSSSLRSGTVQEEETSQMVREQQTIFLRLAHGHLKGTNLSAKPLEEGWYSYKEHTSLKRTSKVKMNSGPVSGGL